MKKYFVFIAILIIASVWTGYYLYNKGKEEPVKFKTTNAAKTDIVKMTVATGSIAPKKEINLKSQVPGIVEKLFVKEGEIVERGQKIAKIKLIPSPANINNAEASIQQIRLRVKEAEAELKRQQSLNTSGADIASAKIAVQEAENELNRQKPLFDEGIISRQVYDQLRADLKTKKSALEQAQSNSGSTTNRFQTDLNVRKAELESAIDNLKILREGASGKSKEVSNIITATLSGMVLDLPLDEGSFVIESNSFNEGSTIAAIADMQDLLFKGKVAESEVGKLNLGMPLEITIGALEDHTFPASLEFIAPKGLDVDGSIQFEIEAKVSPSKDVFIRAGYSANANIILAKKEQVLALAEKDIIFKKDSTFVEVETGEQEFEKRPIKVGLSDGINIEITDGISESTPIKVQNSGS